MTASSKPRISVIGLGYVGLPLAIALARHFHVTGFDIGRERIEELRKGVDRTGEVSPEELKTTHINFTCEDREIAGSDVIIVAVPTPVNEENEPDLGLLLSACVTIGKRLHKGTTVVFESTVYPGVTEEVCGAGSWSC